MKAVIYDMDGLIIDSEPLWRRAEMEVFHEVGIHLSEEDCKNTMGYRLNEVVDLWFSRKPWEGKSKKDVELDILSSVKKLILTEGNSMPGFYESIDRFKNKRFLIAIASSSPMMLIEAVLQKLDVADQFDVIHSAEFEEYGKPHPAVFLSTAKKLNTAPEDCLVLEDSLHGVIAALAAKMRVIAIPDKAGYKDMRFKVAHSVQPSLYQAHT